MKTKIINIRVEEDLYKNLKNIADIKSLSLSSFTRMILKEYANERIRLLNTKQNKQ